MTEFLRAHAPYWIFWTVWSVACGVFFHYQVGRLIRRDGWRHGGIQDFGKGTLATLHGREAVIPEQGLRALLKKRRG